MKVTIIGYNLGQNNTGRVLPFKSHIESRKNTKFYFCILDKVTSLQLSH